MKISFKGDYALKIILDLALHADRNIIPIKDIARRQDIPERFLEQIVTVLKGGGYVKTVRGPRGGIGLAKRPAAITMGEIIRLMDGPTSPIACVSRSCYGPCGFESHCALKGVFAEVRDRINAIVDGVNFQKLAEQSRALQTPTVLDYAI